MNIGLGFLGTLTSLMGVGFTITSAQICQRGLDGTGEFIGAMVLFGFAAACFGNMED